MPCALLPYTSTTVPLSHISRWPVPSSLPQSLKDSGRGPAICNSIIATAIECNLDKDVSLPEGDAKDISDEERDLVIGNVYRKLMEIESRLLPCGLHVVGVPPTAEEAVATLVNIAEIDRPDNDPPVKGLPGILARAVGRDIEEVYANNNKGVLADVQLLQDITETSRNCVREFVKGKTGPDGRIKERDLLGAMAAFAGLAVDPWVNGVKGTKFASADRIQLRELFGYLEFCLNQVVKDNELGALNVGLAGRYVEPGPGGDPIRNPGVLPTGKNIHALDPQSIPTVAACKSAAVVVERLLERQKEENGGVYPETIALVLWGTDNIKTYGESLAQVRGRLAQLPVLSLLISSCASPLLWQISAARPPISLKLFQCKDCPPLAAHPKKNSPLSTLPPSPPHLYQPGLSRRSFGWSVFAPWLMLLAASTSSRSSHWRSSAALALTSWSTALAFSATCSSTR